MAKAIVSDQLSEIVEPLIPRPDRRFRSHPLSCAPYTTHATGPGSPLGDGETGASVTSWLLRDQLRRQVYTDWKRTNGFTGRVPQFLRHLVRWKVRSERCLRCLQTARWRSRGSRTTAEHWRLLKCHSPG